MKLAPRARLWVEVIIAEVTCLVFVRLSAWFDPDTPIAPYWWPLLLLLGISLGLYGRCRILMIVPSICLLSLIIDHLIDGFLYSGSGLTDFLPDDIDMVMLLTISAVIMIG